MKINSIIGGTVGDLFHPGIVLANTTGKIRLLNIRSLLSSVEPYGLAPAPLGYGDDDILPTRE